MLPLSPALRGLFQQKEMRAFLEEKARRRLEFLLDVLKGGVAAPCAKSCKLLPPSFNKYRFDSLTVNHDPGL